jgi:hypothetical protein
MIIDLELAAKQQEKVGVTRAFVAFVYLKSCGVLKLFYITIYVHLPM